jgi:hypothetical protein
VPREILGAILSLTGAQLALGSCDFSPPWSVRVSLANLPDAAYEEIGSQIEAPSWGNMPKRGGSRRRADPAMRRFRPMDGVAGSFLPRS